MDLTSLRVALVAGLALCWVPISLWLLWRSHAKSRLQHSSAADLQARSQLQVFRNGRRDALTGLASRSAFLETLVATMAAGRRCTLMVLDLDHFAAVNTNHGDTTGDELLCALADRLRGLVGTSDHAARLGDDAFALLIADFDADAVAPLDDEATRILHVLTAPYPAAGQLIDLRLGMGIARAPEHASTAENLLRAAQLALGQAKSLGGNTWCGCGDELTKTLQAREKFRGQLRRAIEDGQIRPWYQPIVRLPSGEIARFEVLARWHHPESGVLTPDQFIPLADELGLSGHLSMALLRQVALDCKAWPSTCRFAFNVSAGQVRDFIGFLNAQPGDWQRRMDLSRLDVEITETALMYDRALALELIHTLHEHGAHAGLDDFGSGISNFSLLRDMPFDSIKIGKVFIQTLMQDPRAEACVLSMLWLGCGLGVEMVADGVEDAATAERLAELGCTLAQGSYYARPAAAEEVPGLLAAQGKLGTPAVRDVDRRLPISHMMNAPAAFSSPEPAVVRA